MLDVDVWDLQSAMELSRRLCVHPQCAVSYICEDRMPRNYDFSLNLIAQNILPADVVRPTLREVEVTGYFNDDDAGAGNFLSTAPF